MSDPLLPDVDGATPLGSDELEGLIPSYVALRRELNAAEQLNILQAESWAFARRRNILDERFLTGLHKRMFGRVWRWAGKYRFSNKNIGVDAYRIQQELLQLLDDCRYWVDHETYGMDEIATRFHHRLVLIHPYPNGNGRHARLAADLLLFANGKERFSWGRKSLQDAGETRDRYISSLQAADRHDIRPLLAFVRS